MQQAVDVMQSGHNTQVPEQWHRAAELPTPATTSVHGTDVTNRQKSIQSLSMCLCCIQQTNLAISLLLGLYASISGATCIAQGAWAQGAAPPLRRLKRTLASGVEAHPARQLCSLVPKAVSILLRA
jgi:hypothetical protein